MKFQYKVVSRDEVDPWTLAGFRLKGEQFSFLYNKGTVLINKSIEPLDKVLEILSAWWRYDIVEDETTDDEFSRLYKNLSEIIGKEAAYQAWAAWLKAAEASRKAKAREKAARFFDEEWGGAQLDVLDTMNGYDSEFLDALFFEAADRAEKDSQYKHFTQVQRDAIFLYAFRCGAESVRQAENHPATV